VANQIKISYDVDADLLEISLGTPRPAVSQEIIPDLFVRYDLNTFEAKKQGNEIVGFTVSNVSLWNAGDFLRLADAFPNGTLKHLIQWIQEDLAGKPMNPVISESSVDIYTPHEHQ
jgi:hypothetical protein